MPNLMHSSLLVRNLRSPMILTGVLRATVMTFLVAALCLLATALPTQAGTSQALTQPRTVPFQGEATVRLNVRSGPGVSTSVLGTIDEGAALTVNEVRAGWYRVNAGDLAGWVSANFVGLPSSAGEPTEDETSAVPPSSTNVTLPFQGVTTSRLNVRSAPSLDGEVYGVLPVGAALSVQQVRPGWYRIIAGAFSGWVSSEFVTTSAPATVQLQPMPPVPWRGRSTVNLNLRSEPDVASSRVAFLPPRREMTVVESQPGWLRIESAELSGWVAAQYVAPIDRDNRQSGTTTSSAPVASQTAGSSARNNEQPASNQGNALAAENSRLAQELATAQAELRLLRSQADDTRTNMTALQEQNQSLTARLEAVTSQMTSSTSDQESLTGLANELNSELTAVRNELAQQQQLRAEVATDLEETQVQLQATSQQADAANARVQQLEQDAEQQHQRDAELAQQVSELEEQLATANVRRNRSQERELKKQNRELQRQLEGLRAEQQSQSEQLQRNESVRAQLAQRNEELEGQMVRVAEELNEVQADIEGANVALRSLQTENTELRTQLQQVQAAADSVPSARQPAALQPSAQAELPAVPLEPLPTPANEPEPVEPLQPEAATELAPEITEQPTRRPVEAPEAAPVPEPDPLDAVPAAVEAWRAAWAGQNPAAYIAAYREGYAPEGTNNAAWRRLRTQRLQTPSFIRVEIGTLRIQGLEQGRVQVSFPQNYSSNTFSDSVIKTLVLEFTQGDGWLIVSESSVSP